MDHILPLMTLVHLQQVTVMSGHFSQHHGNSINLEGPELHASFLITFFAAPAHLTWLHLKEF